MFVRNTKYEKLVNSIVFNVDLDMAKEFRFVLAFLVAAWLVSFSNPLSFWSETRKRVEFSYPAAFKPLGILFFPFYPPTRKSRWRPIIDCKITTDVFDCSFALIVPIRLFIVPCIYQMYDIYYVYLIFIYT